MVHAVLRVSSALLVLYVVKKCMYFTLWSYTDDSGVEASFPFNAITIDFLDRFQKEKKMRSVVGRKLCSPW